MLNAGLQAARHIRDNQWDEAAGLFLLNPGAVPHVDLGDIRLHPIRESALHAFADVMDGNTSRAIIALSNVLDHQWPVTGTPWSGTFKVTAEEAEPPSEAVAFVHYDPNWRQFVGCTLAVIQREFAQVLPDSLVVRITSAINDCVAGEPEGRIPDWYTNPGLMAAWSGANHADPDLRGAAQRRAARIVARFDRHGDVDEYNSPTYDGVDLLALALWIKYPPNEWFAQAGARIAQGICKRIAALYHPSLGAVAGPYTRAYGIDMRRYVSFLGMFLAAFGETRTLPDRLDRDTDHSHDLSFLPLVAHLSDAISPFFKAIGVDAHRRHDQSFTGTHASSMLTLDSAAGVERGRRHAASRDQYVPVTVHRRLGGVVDSIGFFLGEETDVDAELADDGTITGRISRGVGNEDAPLTILLAASQEPLVVGSTIEVGGISIEFSAMPQVGEPDPRLGRYPLVFAAETGFRMSA